MLLAPATPPALVDSLWELLAREPEVHEVLHAVTSASSGSLAQIPWFGIVEFRDSLRVFLRGDIELTAQLAAGPVELNGSDVTTWTERRLSAPESYKVSVPGEPGRGSRTPAGGGRCAVAEPHGGTRCRGPAADAGDTGNARTEAGVPAEVRLAEMPVAEGRWLQYPSRTSRRRQGHC